MTKLLNIFLITLGLAFFSTGVSAEELKSSSSHATNKIDWFMLFDMGRYSENASIGFDDIPEDHNGYELRHTLFSGKFGVGVRISPKVSLVLQYARGPEDRLELHSGQDNQDGLKSVSSRFVSVALNREFNVNVTDSVYAKIGIARATFENRHRFGQINDTFSRNTEVKPVVALAYRRAFSQRWSGVVEVTNYFLSEPESVTSTAVGFRFDL